jgi:hypothetical protein
MSPTHTAVADARARPIDVAPILLVALALLVVAIVYGELAVALAGLTLQIPYKTLARALALTWVVLLVVPSRRLRSSYRPAPGDVPLALFAAAAALSVAHAGGHWGDVRNLLAGIGIAGLARSLFAPAARRPLLLHYLGAAVLLVLARELVANPGLLLPPREAGRYLLVTANPNPLGFLFAMTAPLFLAEALVAAGGRRLVATAYYGGAVLGTLLTFSRSAAFGLGLGTVLVLLTIAPRRRTLAIAVAVAGCMAFVLLQRPDTWLATRARGDADRARIMRTSLSLAREAPLLGIGFGINNLEERFPARYEQLYGERLFRYHSANQLVDLLVGTGIVGTALAVAWVVGLLRAAGAALRAARGRERVRAAARLATLVVIVIMSVNEPPLYAGKLVPVLFLVIAAVQLGAASTASARTGDRARASP